MLAPLPISESRQHDSDVWLHTQLGTDISPSHDCRTWRMQLVPTTIALTALTGSHFIKAWLGVVKGHAILWSHGMQHGDPSLSNIAYDPVAGQGALLDFDLSIPARPHPRLAGTMPFMAVELLCEKYWSGTKERLYHHELEALIWILPFVFLRYQDGREMPEQITDAWMSEDYDTVCSEKNYFWGAKGLDEATTVMETKLNFAKEWPLASNLLSMAQVTHIKALGSPKGSFFPVEPVISTVQELWTALLNMLNRAQQAEGLGYLKPFIKELESVDVSAK
ncbi:hypothetical protein DXG03_006896 [Asterophora parasitica]|uniref:Fungal-type protein kinase domain-containing protein n=1 Tax=Asterophora parasitica TaxID=117018 RepID=A0A9P7FYW0_9AGAR|nr:hypothetical protein DXG03_006896 [Asterophora parasitica]